MVSVCCLRFKALAGDHSSLSVSAGGFEMLAEEELVAPLWFVLRPLVLKKS